MKGGRDYRSEPEQGADGGQPETVSSQSMIPSVPLIANTAPPPRCRLYGKNGMFGRLIPSGGDECALITDTYSPCKMEMHGHAPDETRCTFFAAELARRIQEETC